MALSLPGLFDFTAGRASATTQRNNQAIADGNQAQSFVQQLNALNTSLNTNDNLQFRNAFAQQDPGTSILDRFNNIASTTNNPFLLNQAVTQQQSLAPLLALSGLQSPNFGIQQGLPNTAQGALTQGLLGFQPIFDQARNQNILQTLATNNPALNAPQFGGQAESTTALGLLSQQLQQAQQQNQQQAQEIADFRRRSAEANAASQQNNSALNPTSTNFSQPPGVQAFNTNPAGVDNVPATRTGG